MTKEELYKILEKDGRYEVVRERAEVVKENYRKYSFFSNLYLIMKDLYSEDWWYIFRVTTYPGSEPRIQFVELPFFTDFHP